MIMSCPHVEPCAECLASDRRSHHQFAWICAVLAPIAALIAFALACELDPRANAWAGMAIGCVMMWHYNRHEARDSQNPTNGERSATTERNGEAPSRPAA